MRISLDWSQWWNSRLASLDHRKKPISENLKTICLRYVAEYLICARKIHLIDYMVNKLSIFVSPYSSTKPTRLIELFITLRNGTWITRLVQVMVMKCQEQWSQINIANIFLLKTKSTDNNGRRSNWSAVANLTSTH